MGIEVGPRGLSRVHFNASPSMPVEAPWAEAFAQYFSGHPFPAHLAIDLDGVPSFTRRVLEACREIPYGVVRSYGEFAAALGRPQAARAVGQALARNPVPIVIPCHRVIGSRGDLTGFIGGLSWKRHLLQHEGVLLAYNAETRSSRHVIVRGTS